MKSIGVQVDEGELMIPSQEEEGNYQLIGVDERITQKKIYRNCGVCGKRHGGVECLKGTDKCFLCKQPGHVKKDCKLHKKRVKDLKRKVHSKRKEPKGYRRCSRCKKRHQNEECLQGTDKCFKCKQSRHMAKECKGLEEDIKDYKEVELVEVPIMSIEQVIMVEEIEEVVIVSY